LNLFDNEVINIPSEIGKLSSLYELNKIEIKIIK